MLKKTIAGPKKTPQEAAAIRDPKTGELLVTKEDIKRTTLEYCINNMKNNTPDDDVKNKVLKRKNEQIKKMNDVNGEDFNVTYDEFKQVLEKFKMNPQKLMTFLSNLEVNIKWQCSHCAKESLNVRKFQSHLEQLHYI